MNSLDNTMMAYIIGIAAIIIIPSYFSDRTFRTSLVYFFIFTGINFVSLIAHSNNPLYAFWTGVVASILSMLSSSAGKYVRAKNPRQSPRDYWNGLEFTKGTEFAIARIEHALGLRDGPIWGQNRLNLQAKNPDRRPYIERRRSQSSDQLRATTEFSTYDRPEYNRDNSDFNENYIDENHNNEIFRALGAPKSVARSSRRTTVQKQEKKQQQLTVPVSFESETAEKRGWVLSLVQHLPFIALIAIALSKIIPIAQESPLTISEAQIWYLSAFPIDEAARNGAGLNNQFLYIELLRQVITYFGDGLLILRAPSIMTYILSIILVYVFGATFITRDIGLALGVLFAFSKFTFDMATKVDTLILLPISVLLLLLSAIYAHRTRSRLFWVGSILASAFILNISPFGFLIVAFIFIGTFIDAVTRIKTQFFRFSVWGLGPVIAIILLWPWTVTNFELDHISWSEIIKSGASLRELIMGISTSLNVDIYLAIPLAIGFILSFGMLVHRSFLNTDKPIMIGGLLFIGSLAPLFFALLLNSELQTASRLSLFVAGFVVLIILGGIGLAQLSTRVPFHASFFVSLFVFMSFMNSQTSTAPIIDFNAALNSYNKVSTSESCVAIYPEKYRYVVLHGMERRPACFYATDNKDSLLPDRMNSKNGTIFYVSQFDDDQASFGKVLENFSSSDWQIDRESLPGISIAKLSRR